MSRKLVLRAGKNEVCLVLGSGFETGERLKSAEGESLK